MFLNAMAGYHLSLTAFLPRQMKPSPYFRKNASVILTHAFVNAVIVLSPLFYTHFDISLLSFVTFVSMTDLIELLMWSSTSSSSITC